VERVTPEHQKDAKWPVYAYQLGGPAPAPRLSPPEDFAPLPPAVAAAAAAKHAKKTSPDGGSTVDAADAAAAESAADIDPSAGAFPSGIPSRTSAQCSGDGSPGSCISC
jgi:hypothetical protein